jgi:polysaccharide export outer membrane protein
MKRSLVFSILLLVTTILLTSCYSRKKVAYFQDNSSAKKDSAVESMKYEPLIQANDIISIYVTSLSPEASAFFNTTAASGDPGEKSAGNLPTAIGYLVDINGNIEIPLVGQIKVGGLTTTKATEIVKKQLEKYLQNPSVRIYFENYRVTLLGEVSRPGVYKVPNEKMTIPEAIGLAGDLTIFGHRDNILVIREENGKKEYARLDLRDKTIFSSPFYYLHPNDIVYVEPNRGRRAGADNFYRVAPIVISSLTLLSVVALSIFK